MNYLISLAVLFVSVSSFAAPSLQCESSIGGRKTTIILYQDVGWKMNFNGIVYENTQVSTRSSKADIVKISAKNNPQSKTIYEFSGVQKCMCEGKLRSAEARVSQ